ncbi:NADPH:quinone reductase [Pusillimonas sp. NJUB218]|uniref:NADPH:quinone reductase n=1 Tax=Pusillimonas sp. NJUB218 TaxID=2023230 RepID=UPI000F4CFB00|nr:NADPH:quinone reductase [Pusillimonas sp. NJUB218]ROT46513.1 NADPH:quinone oxidoreductase [Pusillimonas sp. NJUB218]
MKAAWYTQNGAAADVLSVGDLPQPEAGPGEVRVRVHTSGVNPSDVKFRQRRPLDFDRIVPHSDGAGVIDQVGAGVDPARLGQRVWVWNAQWARAWGTAAEYVVLPDAQAVLLPDTVDFASAAGFGIPLLTAVQAIRLAGNLAGQTVLVTGAGNAVGHYVTQLAVQAGAQVLGTAGSPEKAGHAQQAGAHAIINYKTEAVGARVLALTKGHGVDVIIDMDFSSTAALLSENVLKPHGRYVCYGSNTTGVLPIDLRTLLWHSNSLHCFLVYDLPAADRAACLDTVAGLLQYGALRHAVAGRFALEDIVNAHQMVESGKKLGTVVVDIAHD